MALVPKEPGSPTGLPAWPWLHSRAVARLGGGPRAQAAGSCQGPRRCPPRPLAQVWRASRPPEVVLPAGDPRPQTALEVTLLRNLLAGERVAVGIRSWSFLALCPPSTKR